MGIAPLVRLARPVGGGGFLGILVSGLPYALLAGLYLTGTEEGFTPPAPFDLVEMEPNEVLPRAYTRAELLGYLEFCRRKRRGTTGALTNEQANRLCRFAWGELPLAKLQLYNLRHVQEHGAQLHIFLGQRAGKSAD